MIELFINFFNFKRFAIGTIVIFLAPLADVSPILFSGESITGKCVANYPGNNRHFSGCSVMFMQDSIEYIRPTNGIYVLGEDVPVMFLKENPYEIVELTFSGIYFTGLSCACVLFFLLWFIGYYSSLEGSIVNSSTSEKMYGLLIKILIAGAIVVVGGIVLILPCFLIARENYNSLVPWAILVTGFFFTMRHIYLTNDNFADIVNRFFKIGEKEKGLDTVKNENPIFNPPPPKKISFFKNLFNTNTAHDFERFSKKMFIIGIIVLLFAPAIGALGPFITGRHGEGKCIGYSYNRSQNIVYSIIEFYPKDSEIAMHYPDDLNLFEVNQQVDLLYIPETPGKVLTLTLFSLYTNFWTGIAFGLLIIWIAAYYASKAMK